MFFIFLQLQAQKDGYVESAGAKIYYRSFGSGTPLLIINGGPGLNSEGFVNLAKILSQQNQAIIYDQRGTGKSVMQQIDASTVNMKLMVEDIENLRKQLKIDKWIILGHSFGGMLASYYATQHPERINCMILSSSGGIDLELLNYISDKLESNLSSQQRDSLHYWSAKMNGGDTTYATRLQYNKILANGYLYNKQYAPAIAARLMQGNHQVGGLIWADLQKIKFNCAPQLASFNKPVLIIQGKQDIVTEGMAQKAHRILKNSKLVLLDNCVHYGWLDRKEAYIGEVEKFIAANQK